MLDLHRRQLAAVVADQPGKGDHRPHREVHTLGGDHRRHADGEDGDGCAAVQDVDQAAEEAAVLPCDGEEAGEERPVDEEDGGEGKGAHESSGGCGG